MQIFHLLLDYMYVVLNGLAGFVIYLDFNI